MGYSREKWSKELTVTTKLYNSNISQVLLLRVLLVLILVAVLVSGQLGTLMI